MRLVIQRVTSARLWANGVSCGEIGTGLVAFLGIAKGDSNRDADFLASKLVSLRIFEDASQKMNLDLQKVGGGILLVSNFTLYASTGKGNRPSFALAAGPEEALPLYKYFVQKLAESGLPLVTGVFQADMKVLVENDGPVTVICDSPVRHL